MAPTPGARRAASCITARPFVSVAKMWSTATANLSWLFSNLFCAVFLSGVRAPLLLEAGVLGDAATLLFVACFFGVMVALGAALPRPALHTTILRCAKFAGWRYRRRRLETEKAADKSMGSRPRREEMQNACLRILSSNSVVPVSRSAQTPGPHLMHKIAANKRTQCPNQTQHYSMLKDTSRSLWF